MRPLRITAVAFIAATGLVLAGCGDDEPTADAPADTSTAEESTTPDDAATEDEGDDTGEVDDVSDFPEVDGFELIELSAAENQTFASAVKGAPQIQDFEGRLVEEGGQQSGLIIRIAIDPEASGLDQFEDQFLPAFASGIAGGGVEPEFEEINGVNVVQIETPDDSGTAYAWVQNSVATVLVFKDGDDAQTFAESALS